MIAVFSCYFYFEFQNLAFVALLQAHDARWNDPSETIMVCQAENMPFSWNIPETKAFLCFKLCSVMGEVWIAKALQICMHFCNLLKVIRL